MTSLSDKTFASDPTVRIIRDRLADGRELIYFDDADTKLPAARKPDLREMPPRPDTADMRFDPLTGDWIAIATTRQNRVFLPPAELDPLAPQTPGNPSEIPDQYDVAVFENKSPAFGPDTSAAPATTVANPHELAVPATGRCEVVCFSPEDSGSLGTLGITRMRTVVEAWAQRTHELSRTPGIVQVFPFENRGEQIGVTLHHPHGQIYAYPFHTPRTRQVLQQIAVSGDGADFFARILAREQVGPRVLAQTEHWTAFVPYAARWPLEVHILPHRHIGLLSQTTLAERTELAALLPELLRGLDLIYDSPTPYMAGWHQAPVLENLTGANDPGKIPPINPDIRLMFTLYSPRRAADKLKFLAGSEAVQGAWISDVAPEASAELFRAALELARSGKHKTCDERGSSRG